MQQLSILHNPALLRGLQIRASRRPNYASNSGVSSMLWTIFVILLVLWLVGVVSSYTLGGFIHLLLVLAVVALIFQLLSGRRVV
jgi:Family of unknown function (DUF5670)